MQRQLLHILFGILIVVLLHYSVITITTLLIIAILSLILSIIIKYVQLPFLSFLHQWERKEDMDSFPGKGVVHYLLGCLLALVLFPKDIALAGIMILALGDSISHIVGRFYGTKKHPLNNKKMLEGWAAGIIAGFFGAVVFVSLPEAFLASVIAMTAEVADWGTRNRILDDNLFIPVIACIIIAAIRLM